jgi:hypothetical protein
MSRRHETDSLKCSFCHKSESDVAKLISSPDDRPRAYICDECIAVCASILEDDREITTAAKAAPLEEPNRLVYHPLVSHFLDSVERWIRQESLGVDAAEEFAEMRSMAIHMIAPVE